MTHVADRAVIFGHLLRSGDRARAVRFVDRLDRDAMAKLIAQLRDEDLGALSAIAFEPTRLARSLALPAVSLVALLRVASDHDAQQALSQLPSGRAARALLALDRPRRRHLAQLLMLGCTGVVVVGSPPRCPVDRVGAALRQRRLFAAS